MDRRILAAAGALLVALCSSCGPEYAGRTDAKNVAVIGDSTIGLSAEEIPPALADTYQQSLVFRSGRTTHDLVPDALDYAVNRPPDIVVIGLGSNDAGLADTVWDERGLASFYDQKEMLDVLWYPRCVVWVNVNEHMLDRDGHTSTAHARSYNAGLRYWAATDSRVHLVDWSAAVAADPELVLYDQVHPSEAGQAELAGMIRTAVDDCADDDV